MGYYINDEVVNSEEYKNIEKNFNAEEYRQAWLKIPIKEKTASFVIPGGEKEKHDYLIELDWYPGKKISLKSEDFLKFLYLRRNSRLMFSLCPKCYRFMSILHIAESIASVCHHCKVGEVTSSGLFDLIGKPQDTCKLEYADILGVKTWNEYYIKNHIYTVNYCEYFDDKIYNSLYDDVFGRFDSESKSMHNDEWKKMLYCLEVKEMEKTRLSKMGISAFTT